MRAEDSPLFLEFVTSNCCDVVFLQEADNLPHDIACKGYVAYKAEGGRTMILLRGFLSKLIKLSILQANFSIVILDTIVLASVYLPNSSYKGDVYAAHSMIFKKIFYAASPRGLSQESEVETSTLKLLAILDTTRASAASSRRRTRPRI